MTSCTPGVSSHILGMLVRLSPVNSVPFPFRPLDCLPHMMSSRVNYRHSRCLISLCVPGVTHCAWHRAAAHCLALTCMMEIRCVLIDHARPQPGDRRCWCALGLAAACVVSIAVEGYQPPPAMAEGHPRARAATQTHRLLCRNVEEMWDDGQGEDFCRSSSWFRSKWRSSIFLGLPSF